LLKDGIEGPEISEVGSEYKPAKIASLIFIFPYVTTFLFVIFDFVKRIVNWKNS